MRNGLPKPITTLLNFFPASTAALTPVVSCATRALGAASDPDSWLDAECEAELGCRIQVGGIKLQGVRQGRLWLDVRLVQQRCDACDKTSSTVTRCRSHNDQGCQWKGHVACHGAALTCMHGFLHGKGCLNCSDVEW